MTALSPTLSVVSPVYQGAPVVAEFVRRVSAAARSVTANFELFLIDDGSTDGSWEEIAAAAAVDPRVKGIRFSRNFGQNQAIWAGLDHAMGEHVVVMDCDLQDDPSYIPVLLAKAREGYDVVGTRRRRKQSRFRLVMTGVFFRLFNLLADEPALDRDVGGYSLINRKVVAALRRVSDVHRHYLATVGWMGFKRTLIAVESAPRFAGKSSYTLAALTRHATSLIFLHSGKLLRFSLVLGGAYLLAAVLGVGYLILAHWGRGAPGGWPALLVLVLASTGCILAAIGILGYYLGTVCDQVRGRPPYLVQEYRNFTVATPADDPEK